MFLFIWFSSLALSLLSANNFIPVQTYPIYQQNGFISPPTSQAINFQPYTPSNTVQNQLQQLNISPSSIKQALLNKLLSSTSAQMILNPNSQSYDTNLYNVLNNQIKRNFVSNSVSGTTENWNLRSNDNYDRNLRNSKSKVRKNRTSNKKSKTKRSQNDVTVIEEDLQKPQIKDGNKTSRKRTRKKNVKETEEIHIAESEKTKNKTTRITDRKQKEQTTEHPIDKNNDRSAKLRRRPKKQKANKHSEGNKSERNSNKKSNNEKENIDLDITHDAIEVDNRKTRNPKQEVTDMFKLYGNTPQEITNQYLANLNQLNNPLMSNWVSHYENIYQSLLNNKPIIVTDKTPKRRRKNKKRRNKKKKNHENGNATETSVIETSNKLNADDIITKLDENPIVESFKPFVVSERNMKYTSNEIFQDGHSLNEFDDHFEPEYYGGYIDDYYPLFTDSAAYTANNKEVILKKLNDNKYYYATDRIETDIPTSTQKSSYEITENPFEIYEAPKHTYEEVESEGLKNIYNENSQKKIDEEIRFQSPPFLESPDFQTRQIDKSEIQHAFDDRIGRYVGDKSFSAKTANFNSSKKNGIRPQAKDIETVYATSKVVAYSPVYIPEEDNSSADTDGHTWSDYDFTSNSYQSGGTTYVLAKSVDR